MDKTAIAEIIAQSVQQDALHQVAELNQTLLHNDYHLINLEGYRQHRQRFRGRFKTVNVHDFVQYVKMYKDDNPLVVFVDDERLHAKAYLNMGNLSTPGHCDHYAALTLCYGAEMDGLERFNGKRYGQKTAAETLEDWRAFITVYDEHEKEIPFVKSVNAIRKMSIKENRGMESEERNFKAERSTFEKVEAKAEVMPAYLHYKVTPHPELSERVFKHRIAIIGGNDIGFAFKPIQPELQRQAIQQEFIALIEGAFGDAEKDTITTIVGDFVP